jgi:hypothetical protein
MNLLSSTDLTFWMWYFIFILRYIFWWKHFLRTLESNVFLRWESTMLLQVILRKEYYLSICVIANNLLKTSLPAHASRQLNSPRECLHTALHSAHYISRIRVHARLHTTSGRSSTLTATFNRLGLCDARRALCPMDTAWEPVGERSHKSSALYYISRQYYETWEYVCNHRAPRELQMVPTPFSNTIHQCSYGKTCVWPIFEPRSADWFRPVLTPRILSTQGRRGTNLDVLWLCARANRRLPLLISFLRHFVFTYNG